MALAPVPPPPTIPGAPIPSPKYIPGGIREAEKGLSPFLLEKVVVHGAWCGHLNSRSISLQFASVLVAHSGIALNRNSVPMYLLVSTAEIRLPSEMKSDSVSARTLESWAAEVSPSGLGGIRA